MRRWVNALGTVLLGVLLACGQAHAQTAPDDAPRGQGAGRPAAGSTQPTRRSGAKSARRAGLRLDPEQAAGTLVQSGGESWRAFRNGPYQTWAGYILLGTVALLSLFFAAARPDRHRARAGRATGSSASTRSSGSSTG